MERDAFNAGRLGPSRCEDGIAKLGGPTSELDFSTTPVMAESVLTVTAGDGKFNSGTWSSLFALAAS
jgi:hypothetical protein